MLTSRRASFLWVPLLTLVLTWGMLVILDWQRGHTFTLASTHTTNPRTTALAAPWTLCPGLRMSHHRPQFCHHLFLTAMSAK